MTALTVGVNQQYSTIESAVAASQAGDTIDVQAGTYTNDFTRVDHSLTLQAIGGMVTMVATVAPPDGKAILDEGGAGVDVNIDGFAFTGAVVPDGNGAGIRYEGGTLSISNSDFYDNQDGILGAPDLNGVISVTSSEFYDSGTGDGETHNIYIGDIQSFSLTNSFVHDENTGNEVKSRAENNTIVDNRILDNLSTASYEIDLPNGGNATITGNTIQQGINSENYNIIAYGEEGNLYPGIDLSVTGNTILNDRGSGPALWNSSSSTVATFADNAVYGFGGAPLVDGAATQSGNTVLSSEPALDESAPYTIPGAPTASPPQPVNIGTGSDTLILTMAEDYYQGDAQFTVSVDSTQVGGVQTTTAINSAGQTQVFNLLGNWGFGAHQVAVTFLNDAYGGSAATDRNLYVQGITYDDASATPGSATLDGGGAGTTQTVDFAVGSTAPTPITPPTPMPNVTAGLVIDVSEDTWQGDAQFVVTVDGQQFGGIQTATASHTDGATQPISLGSLLSGSHLVGVSFINDAYGGTTSTDRNLYVDSAVYNGQTIAGSSATLLSNGTTSFGVTGDLSQSSALVLNVTEDAWQGDAQFTVSIDGQTTGAVYTATASNALGQIQAFAIDAPLAVGSHTVGVTFFNDAYGGSPSTDRNLYVTGATFDGQAIAGSAANLFGNSTDSFAITIPPH